MPCPYQGDEILPKEARGVGIVVHAEHELAAGRVEPCAPPEHLVEGDGRAHVLEKDDVAHTGHVHAGGEQLHGGGDEVRARGPPQLGQVLRAAHAGRALEGIRLQALLAILGAPGGVEIIHLGSHPIGVGIAGAEDDRLLLGAARSQQVLEEVRGHGLHPVGQKEAILEAGGHVLLAGHGRAEPLAGGGVVELLPLKVLA